MGIRLPRHARIGRSRAAELARRFGSELRLARTAIGLTQHQLASLAGVSQSVVSRAERATRRPDWSTACALASASGHELGIKLYPSDGLALRDRGQLHAVQALVAEAHPSWHATIEQPISTRDRRAADLVLRGPTETIHIEVERALVDLQAQLRAAQLKRSALVEQLGRAVRLVIAVPGTRRSRRVVSELMSTTRAAMPASSRAIWASIRSGSDLGADGFLFLPPDHRKADGARD
ncbi:MAG TPA: helix-turn-helix transcriptional regulator [Candidatus Limnocylindria bacterium]|nr:helix-turn-helix transcriptional regulator [Candidatus Limnocylindria bacterium]